MQAVFDTNISPILVALGSNLSYDGKTSQDLLFKAIQLMERKGIHIIRESRLYSTPAFPAGSGPNYVNAAVCAMCDQQFTPDQMLKIFHEVEQELGRTRQNRWESRSLDLDLIAVGDSILPSLSVQTAWRNLDLVTQQQQVPQELILPHPRLQDRAFVLGPLADVAPDWVHPVLQKTVVEMLTDLPAKDRDEMVVLSQTITPTV